MNTVNVIDNTEDHCCLEEIVQCVSDFHPTNAKLTISRICASEKLTINIDFEGITVFNNVKSFNSTDNQLKTKCE